MKKTPSPPWSVSSLTTAVLLLLTTTLGFAQDTLRAAATPTPIARLTLVAPVSNDTLWLVSASRFRVDKQLRATVAGLHLSPFQSIWATYEQMLQDCEKVKSEIAGNSNKVVKENAIQLAMLSEELSTTKALLTVAQQDLANARANGQAAITTVRKARRRLWIERIGYAAGGMILGAVGVSAFR